MDSTIKAIDNVLGGTTDNTMESDTAQTVTVAGKRAELDASAKRLVANKPILAYILKSALDEYADVPVERIAEEFRICRKITDTSWLVYFSDCTGQKAST